MFPGLYTLVLRWYWVSYSHRIRISQKQRQRSSLVVGGWNWFNDALYCSARMIWRKGWFEEQTLGIMEDLKKWMIIRFTPHQTTTLPKTFFQIILAAKSIVQHSIQLRPSIISDDLFGFPSVRFLLYGFSTWIQRCGDSARDGPPLRATGSNSAKRSQVCRQVWTLSVRLLPAIMRPPNHLRSLSCGS